MTKKRKGTGGLLGQINAIKKAGFKENKFEYGLVVDQSAAGTRNLQRQLGRIDRQLTRTVERNVANVSHLSQRAKEVQRQTRRKTQAQGDRYGSSLQASANQQFQGANTAASVGVQGLRGARTVAARGANMAEGVMGIAASAAKAGKASADYMYAQALAARNAVTAEAALQATQAILLQRLEFQQQKKLLELENKETAEGGVPGVTSAVTSATAAAPELMRYLNSPNAAKEAGIAGAKKYATPFQAASAYMAEQGIDPTSAQGQMITALAQQLWNKGAGFVNHETGADQDADGDGWYRRPGGVAGQEDQIVKLAANQTFSALYPDMWKKHKDDILGNVDVAADSWLLSSTGTTGPASAAKIAAVEKQLAAAKKEKVDPLIIAALEELLKNMRQGIRTPTSANYSGGTNDVAKTGSIRPTNEQSDTLGF